MTSDYMVTLREVFKEVLTDENEFNRAKKVSQRILSFFEGENFAVILAALYLTAMAVIDCVELGRHSNEFYN